MALYLVQLKTKKPTADDAVAVRAYMQEIGAVEVVRFEWMITSPQSIKELADDLATKLGPDNRLAIQEVTKGL
jgi:hypothetical protein